MNLRRRAWPADRPGWWAAAALAAGLAGASWARHAAFWTGGFDLGIFDQAVWLMSRGIAPEVTINGRNIFADHFSPVLLLFVPLYRLTASPFWLLAVQAAAVGATVLPLRRLARELGAPPVVATAATLMSAPLLAAAVYDFHPSTLAVPALAWATLGAVRGDVRSSGIAGVVVVLCRADLGLLLLAMMPIAQARTRKVLMGVGLAGVALGAIVPTLLGGRGTWETHYGHLGDGPVDALTHPWQVLDALLSTDAATTLVIWLLPVGFLPVLRPRWMLAVLIAGLPVLVSQWSNTHVPWFHYGAPLVPLTVGGALDVVGRPPRSVPRAGVAMIPGIALALLYTSPLAPRAPDDYQLWRFVTPERGVDRAAAVSLVEQGEAVAADNRSLAHLAHRREAWPFPSPFRPVEPAGIGPEPSRAAAARVTVVITTAEDADTVRQEGFEPAADVRGLVVARS